MFRSTFLTILGVTAAALLGSAQQAQAATLSVNCGTGGNLQSKINAAPGGSTILVKGTCVGTFQIAGKGLTIKGNPSATLDGNKAGSVLTVSAAGKTVHLVGLTITKGWAPKGGGVYKTAGTLTLNRVTLKLNRAATSGAGEYARGGGIASLAGNVTVTDSKVIDNVALSWGDSVGSVGGGLDVAAGKLVIRRSLFSGNDATSSPTSGVANAYGGGFYLGGDLLIEESTFFHNLAVTHGHSTAQAFGSAGYQSYGSSAVVSDTTIKNGWASADTSAGHAVSGPALGLASASVLVTRSRIVANTSWADSSSGNADVYGAGLYGELLKVSRSKIAGNTSTAKGDDAKAFGAGMYGGVITLSRSTVNDNRVVAQATTGDSFGEGGGIYAHQKATISASTVSRNRVVTSTAAVDIAQSFAGGVFTEVLKATNSTIALNQVVANAAAPGATAGAAGGGIVVTGGPSSIVSSTIAGNTTARSATNGGGGAGGLYGNPKLTLRATIVANNVGAIAPDCTGAPVSAGYNLIRTNASCLTGKPSDRLDKNPRLGALQANGGPTQTMAIAKASPARNAMAKCVVRKDQRLVRRPQAGRCDIGAYERRIG